MLDPDDTDAAGDPAASDPGGGWTPRTDTPLYSATLWPNRSLERGGMRWVYAVAALGVSVPLLPALGTPVFWGLLPFMMAPLAMLWLSFRSNNRAGQLSEQVSVWRDEMRVERREPNGRVLRWRANPYWVRLTIHAAARPENYLTLKGGGREIELGAFLSPDERLSLRDEIETALARARAPQ